MQIRLHKLEQTLDVDYDAMPENAKAHVIHYGLTQLLNDAMVSAKDNAERRALSMKRLDGLMSGNIRATREADPIARECTKLATARATAEFKKDGKTIIGSDKRVVKAFADRVAELAGHPKVVEVAEANVAAAKALTDMELD